ncbi:hypothetical protein SLEP1_g46965 [Rubroshorea leprosula]|uniref:CCT domain-containing protein n=1 Tax=Rubroshorea leprosula TaxID=152421 RepID=A0AAV5LNY4_9ROSI|nr:hypothetical protein SLEP1_g46965 [Rubroshorea leprosula]
MLQDVIQPPEQLLIDEISSPIIGPVLDFCDTDLFPENPQNPEVTSNSCYEENSSYATNLSMPLEIKKLSSYQDNHGMTNIATSTTTTTTTTVFTATATTNNNTGNLSIIFDSPDETDNEISIDFAPSPPFSFPHFPTTHPDQFDHTLVQPQIPSTDVVDGLTRYSAEPVVPLMGPPLPAVFEEDCLSPIPSYVPLNPSSPSFTLLGTSMATFMPAGAMTAALPADSSGIFAGSLLMGSELQLQELEYQGDNGGIFCPDSMQHAFNLGDLQQVLTNESQQLGAVAASSTPITSEISGLEDSTFNKLGKLSAEQRREKIHRYMKKRNERNFSKKIKYACRKTLADSRPRVRGRFAKNDDFGETTRPTCSNHEEEDDEEVVVRAGEDMVDSSDIFAHISGVNSLKCNYPIQSWI